MVKMYIIIVYDIKKERVNKVKSFLRQHIYWIQNSVFEGEVTKSQYETIQTGLKKIIKQDEDSIIIYNAKMQQMINKEIIGIEKSPIEQIL